MEREISYNVIMDWRCMVHDLVKTMKSHEMFQNVIQNEKDYIAEDNVLSHHRSFYSDKLKKVANDTENAALYITFLNLERYLAHLQLCDYEYFNKSIKETDSSDIIISIDYNYIMDVLRDVLFDYPMKEEDEESEKFLDAVSCLRARIIYQCSSILQ